MWMFCRKTLQALEKIHYETIKTAFKKDVLKRPSCLKQEVFIHQKQEIHLLETYKHSNYRNLQASDWYKSCNYESLC